MASRTRRLGRSIALAGLVLGATFTTSIPTVSANSRDVIREGSCSRLTDWTLKLSPENGRIEVEGEVDSNRVGQTWSVVIKHNNVVVARTTRKTLAPSGSFEYRRVEANRSGPDRITAYSRNPVTGEVCSAAASF